METRHSLWKLPKLESLEKCPIKKNEMNSEEQQLLIRRNACDQRAFRKIAIPFSQIRYLRNFRISRELLAGCLVACKMKGTETVIVDEIELLNHKSISFKHSSSVHYFVDDLDDAQLTNETYESWIKDMAKWDEPLSVFGEFEKRREKVYEERREKMEVWSEQKRKRKADEENEEEERQNKRNGDNRNGQNERNGNNRNGQNERNGDNQNGQNGRRNDGIDQRQTDDDAGEEPPLDALVHSAQMLQKAIFPFLEMKYLAQKGVEATHPLMVGCLTVCKLNENPNKVIVDEVYLIDRLQIIFKQSPTKPYRHMHLNYQKVTEEIFSNWIDDLVKRDVRLPLYQPYKDRREALFQLRINNDGKWPTDTPKQHKIPRQPPPTFVQTFGADILSCMVNPWHLIHLQLLGPRDFEKVAIGLYVRCKVKELCSVERIERVSWDASPPYEIYGRQMQVLLHFYGPSQTPPSPISAVQFPSTEIDRQVVEQQRKCHTFVPPSGNHIKRKSEELQNALYKIHY